MNNDGVYWLVQETINFLTLWNKNFIWAKNKKINFLWSRMSYIKKYYKELNLMKLFKYPNLNQNQKLELET